MQVGAVTLSFNEPGHVLPEFGLVCIDVAVVQKDWKRYALYWHDGSGWQNVKRLQEHSSVYIAASQLEEAIMNNSYNAPGHVCPSTNRVCVPLAEMDASRPAWLCYPWSEHKAAGMWREVREVRARRIIFASGQHRALMDGEPMVVYQ